MTTPPPPRPARRRRPTSAALAATAALFAAASTHCGAAPPRPTPGGPAIRATGPRAAPPDTSPVTAPTNLAAVVRVPSPSALAERLGALTGQPALVTQLIDQMLEVYGSEIAGAVDRNAPVDAAVMWMEQSRDIDVVVSLGAPAMDRLENALGQSFRFVPVGNGVMQLEPLGGGGGRGDGMDDVLMPGRGNLQQQPQQSQQGEGARGRGARSREKCVVAPTATAGATRIVCASHPETIEAAAPFLARTLVRTPGPADAVRFEVVPAFLRARMGRESAAEIARARAEFDADVAAGRTPLTRDPAARDALLRLGHDVLESAQSLVDSATGLRGALALGEQRATLHVEYELTDARGDLLRGVIAAGRAGASGGVPADLLARMLPDGWLYSAGAVDTRELRASVTALRAFLTAALPMVPGLRPPDRAAVQSAFALLDQLDQTAVVTAMGHDAQGQPWLAGTVRGATVPAAQSVAALRTLVTVMRRPAVLAMLRRERIVDPGDLRDVPVRGLPPGSFAFRLPRLETLLDSSRLGTNTPRAVPPPPPPTSPAGRPPRGRTGGAAATSARPGAASAASTVQQVLLVPSGQDVAVFMGPDASALFTRYQASHPPAVDPQVFTGPNAANAVVAFVPAGLPSLLRAGGNAQTATGIEQLVNGLPDRGRTPVVLRAGAADAPGGGVQLRGDLEIGAVTIRALMGVLLAMRSP